MRSMTFGEFEEKAVPVKPEPSLQSVAMDLYQSNAMNGEAGEVANVVKKMVRDGESITLDDKLLDECGDVLFYMGRLLRRRGMTIEQAALALLRKLDGARQRTELEKTVNEKVRPADG